MASQTFSVSVNGNTSTNNIEVTFSTGVDVYTVFGGSDLGSRKQNNVSGIIVPVGELPFSCAISVHNALYGACMLTVKVYNNRIYAFLYQFFNQIVYENTTPIANSISYYASDPVYFTFLPTSAVDIVQLQSPTLETVVVDLSEIEETHGSWPATYGNSINVNMVPSESHILLKPKVGTKPNVTQTVDVTVGGTTATYPLTQNPQINLEAGKDMQVQVSSPAPTVTVDYTNTTTPVITDTPTGG